MIELTTTNRAIVVGYRPSLFLSAAFLALVCMSVGARPAAAQSVIGNGDVNPSPMVTSGWADGDALLVGESGSGSLAIAGGGTVSNNYSSIGYNAGSSGAVTVSGTDGNGNTSTWTIANDFNVGFDGAGSLTIDGGGVVNSAVNNVNANIGLDAGALGQVTVSGTDGNGHASTWTNNGNLLVGVDGAGSLTIDGGGAVNNGDGYIGFDASGQGRVTVSGADGNGHASTWTNTGNLFVGVDGAGSLTINGGGTVNSVAGWIGFDVGSAGTVTVSGTDGNGHASTWNATDLLVGYNGIGSLSIKDGGTVTGIAGNTVDIGYSRGSAGAVTVSSSNDSVSTWTAGEGIAVGYDGSGTLTIDTGGLVSVGDSVVVAAGHASAGSLNLLGDASGRGILQTGAVIKGTGAALLNLDGGILRAIRDETNFLDGFDALTVRDGGAWFDTDGYNIAVGTGFSGSSSFNKLGLGTLTLTGDSSSFTGTTAISGGTLQLGDGGTSGVMGGDIADEGSLVFNRSDGGLVLAGAISGSGTVSQIGTGTTTLTGVNTYTGGTTISAGTLSVAADNNLGAASGALTFNGGILQITGTEFSSTPRTINWGDNGGGFDIVEAAHDFTVNQSLTGIGPLTKLGAGTLTLTNTNTYSGPTTVIGGTLSVNGSIAASAVTVKSGATLGGNGTVGATTILAGGNIAPGNSIGTLHINGAFAQAANSVYQVQLDPNSNASDLIAVNGAATLAAGAGLNVTKIAPGDYKPGTTYTVLTATDGLTGTYVLSGQTTTLSPYISLKDSYDANNAYLTVVQTADPGDAAQTGNQTQTTTGIDSLPATGGVGSAVLNTQNTVATRSAFDHLSGEALASAKNVLVSGSLLVRDTTFGRLRDVFCAGVSDEPHRSGYRAVCPSQSDRPTVWAQGFGSWGHVGGNGNAAALSESVGGFLVGVDMPVYDWRVGYFSGFSRTNFDVRARSSSGNSNNYHLGMYGGTQWGDLGLRLGASYSWSGLLTDRSVVVGDLSNDLRANYNAGTTQVFGELGQRFAFSRFMLEPFANLAYVNLRTDGFSETGGDAALTAKAGTMEDTFTTFGLRPSTDISWGSFNATVRGMAGWRHAFGDVTPSSTVSFAGGDTFTVSGTPISRDAGVIEAGLDFTVHDNLTAGLTYGGQFGSHETDHSIRGTVAITF